MYTDRQRFTPPRENLIDRAVEYFAPKAAAARRQARYTMALARHFEGASVSRRTAGWRTPMSGPNDALRGGIDRLRARSRDLTRNNSWASKAIGVIESNTIGTGIVPKAIHKDPKIAKRAQDLWNAWAGTTKCDPAGKQNFYAMLGTACREVAEGGESLVRRRFRKPSDGLPVPLQLQWLEAEHLDSTKHGDFSGGERVQGVEFDLVGRLRGYHLFRRHPGEYGTFSTESTLIDAADVAHVFRIDRHGQARGVPWGAPCIIRLRDFDEFEDAVLLRQKIANLFGVIITRPEGMGGLGDSVGAPADSTDGSRSMTSMEPAMIKYAANGEQVSLLEPPDAGGYPDYSRVSLLSVAAGFQVTYESLTGDLSRTNFSAGRMGWLEMARAVSKWQWQVFVPQICDRVWEWFIEAAIDSGQLDEPVGVSWTPPYREMIDPVQETNAIKAAVRAGIMTRHEACLMYGRDPFEVLDTNAKDFESARAKGLLLDVDPAADLGRKNGPLAEKPPATKTSEKSAA